MSTEPLRRKDAMRIILILLASVSVANYNHQPVNKDSIGNYFVFLETFGWGDDYLLAYLLTPWCRVLLEKLTGLQLLKKFPAFLWNPKVHYRTHKRPPPVPILGQPNPVHIPTSHLLEIHPNIIHPSTLTSGLFCLQSRHPACKYFLT